ncbi:MAG: hypothetical protein OXD54_00770 [Candidatus Poribacteria bacterium]|nr:hypothetical protein [Candidatus Poribacteria bacterium]
MPNNDTHPQSSLLKNILLITPLSLIGRGGTLLIYIALANWFGDTAEMDFIYYYWGIAEFLIALLSGATAYSVLVPLLAEARQKGETDAQRCVQSIFTRYIMLMPLLSCILGTVSWGISQLFFPNVGLTASTTIAIICGFLCLTIISSVRWILKAILDTYQAFYIPVIVHALRAVIVIVAIFLCKPYVSWFSIPIALILGELFQVVILFQRCGATLNIPIRSLFTGTRNRTETSEVPYTKQFLRQCLVMVGAAISDGMNPVVDRGMGSALGPSSVSKLDYSFRLCAIPETLTGVTLPVLLSHWAKISSSENIQKLQQSVWRGVLAVIILMVPFLLGFYLFRSNIVAILFGHGQMSAAGQQHIASLLGIYLIGMLPRLISRLLIRAHLARQNHFTVLTTTLIRLILNPVLNWIFMRYWGLEGIAWSTALLSYPICAFIAIEFWRKCQTSEKRSG